MVRLWRFDLIIKKSEAISTFDVERSMFSVHPKQIPSGPGFFTPEQYITKAGPEVPDDKIGKSEQQSDSGSDSIVAVTL